MEGAADDRAGARPRAQEDVTADQHTVGRPDTRREGLGPTMMGWLRYRRVGLAWDAVGVLFPYVGAIRRVQLATRDAPSSSDSIAVRNDFLALNEGGFQIPSLIRTDRLTVQTSVEASYVRAMDRWFLSVRDHAHPPIIAPDTWFVRELHDLSPQAGTRESVGYRARRLELTLARVSGRYIPFDEYMLLRRDRSERTPYRMENLRSSSDVNELLRVPITQFAVLPEAIRRVLPAPRLAIPRLRALYYFGDVLRSPESYDLEGDDLALYTSNLARAAEFEWAHCLAVALEADFRATGRVIIQPPTIAMFIRQHLIDRPIPGIQMGPIEEAQEPINVGALVDRLERVANLTDDYLYGRVDNATNVQVRWAYMIEGTFRQSGPRHGRFGGTCVLASRIPQDSHHTPRPMRGEPGYQPAGTETLRTRINGREVQEHLPHAYRYVGRVFRGNHLMPIQNVMETLVHQLRRNEDDLGRLDWEVRQAVEARDEEQRGRGTDRAWFEGENHRLRNERNAARAELGPLREEVNRQAALLQSLVASQGHGGAYPPSHAAAPGPLYGAPPPYPGAATTHNSPALVPSAAGAVPAVPGGYMHAPVGGGAQVPYGAAGPSNAVPYGGSPAGYHHSPVGAPGARVTITQQPPATSRGPPTSNAAPPPSGAPYPNSAGYSYRNPFP